MTLLELHPTGWRSAEFPLRANWSSVQVARLLEAASPFGISTALAIG